MKEEKEQNEGLNAKTAAAIGAGALAAAAAAAAGYYFYASKDAKENRRIFSKWAQDLKADVLRRASKLGEIDRDAILAAIDQALAAYESVRGVRQADLMRAGAELKENWQSIVSELKRGFAATPAKVRTSRAKKTRTARKRKSSDA